MEPAQALMELETPLMEPESQQIMAWTEAKTHLQALYDDWREDRENTERRRKVRKVSVDVEKLRKDGMLDEDETLVPVRIVDLNITREIPPYVNYIVNSRRLCTFYCEDDPMQDTGRLETEFSRGMRYKGWELPHFKVIDGCITHAWDGAEVIYDETKPLHVSIEHIGHDKLFFGRNITDIQQAPRVIRQYDVTITKLRSWVKKFGFSAEQVEKLYRKIENTKRVNEALCVYKVLFKVSGVVHIAWFSLEGDVTDWLKPPEKYNIGIKFQQTDPMTQQQTWAPSDLLVYPIFPLYYRITEEKKITDNLGRADLDKEKQESQTSILSAFINGTNRASMPFASLESSDPESSLKELEIKLIPGRILSKPLRYFAPPWPDPVMLKFLQYSDTSNAEETNQVNFAAMNRQDSRKTATEIAAAQEAQSILNTVQLVLFSTYIRTLYDFVWTIVQSLAIQGEIKFLLIQQQQPIINPLDGQPVIDQMTMQPQMQTAMVNDIATLSKKYSVSSAGDVDVVQRQQKINMMMQDWPVISMTPLRDVFLADLIKLKYPDSGERYAKILEQSGMIMQMQGLVKGLASVVQGTLDKEEVASLPPDQQQQLQQMLQMAEQLGSMPMNGQPQPTAQNDKQSV